MKHYDKEQTYVRRLGGVTCDRCKHTVRDEGSGTYAQMQEFVTIEGEGGYASKHWGDGTVWGVDLCEKCQHELFASFAQID